MCGINLFVSKREKTNEQVILKMNKSISHRGPDHSAFASFPFGAGHGFIGNNRLKITDSSDQANQPMFSADKRYCLSFNGEIYNFKKIKTTLAQTIKFQTQSDTEVLLYHLIQKGKSGILELEGMFSFIFIDLETQKIWIVRDEHGIKPLFYYSDQNHFIASSEIKGILASSVVEKKLNINQIPFYLTYKYPKAPETFYQQVFELMPGEMIEIQQNTFTVAPWPKNNINHHSATIDENKIKKIEQLLVESVATQLETKQTKGVFLSGGVDSTLLIAIADKILGKPIPSFSISHLKSDELFGTDDYKYASRAAKQYNSPFHEFGIDKTMLQAYDDFLQTIDQPIGDSATFLTWYLSKKSSPYIRVAYSGAGADEWFAGYNRHLAYHYYFSLIHNNKLLLKAFKKTANILQGNHINALKKPLRLYNKFASSIDDSPAITFQNFISTAWKSEAKLFQKESSFSLLDGINHDRTNYLPFDVLALTDNASMANSLEVRLPYLGNELTNYLAGLPAEFLLRHGKKWILKEFLNRLEGPHFTTRKKEGFGLPIGNWLLQEQNNAFSESIKNKNAILFEFIDYTTIQRIYTEHTTNKFDHSAILWSVIHLSNWLTKEFK